ncbi:unnamed protein product [Schistosoma margrebowiei]|uniref:Uncharacterized protein n=1 Tax=Schistosoma margrebowiei TaxID=48269 RepID=A0A183M4Z4_9TREM|nr:unnamed protein product [Schistosoma margrebowiei]
MIKQIHCKKRFVHWKDEIESNDSLCYFVSSSSSSSSSSCSCSTKNRSYLKTFSHSLSLISSCSYSSTLSSSSSSLSSSSLPSSLLFPLPNSSSFSSYSSSEKLVFLSNYCSESDIYSSYDSDIITCSKSLMNKQLSDPLSISSSSILSNQEFTKMKYTKDTVHVKSKLIISYKLN